MIYWRKNIYADYELLEKKMEKWIQKDNALLMLIHLSSFLARFFLKLSIQFFVCLNAKVMAL